MNGMEKARITVLICGLVDTLPPEIQEQTYNLFLDNYKQQPEGFAESLFASIKKVVNETDERFEQIFLQAKSPKPNDKFGFGKTRFDFN